MGEHPSLAGDLTPTVAEALGGLTVGVFPKLADGTLGVTAALSPRPSEVFAGWATAGALSELVGEHRSLTRDLTPTLAGAFGGLTTGIFPKLADETLGVTAGLPSMLPEAFPLGTTAGALSELAGEHASLTRDLTPTLAEALGGLTAGVFPKLADETLGVTAALSPRLSEVFAGWATAGALSELVGEHRSLTRDLTPTLAGAFGGLTTGIFPKLADETLGVTAGLPSMLPEAFPLGTTAGALSELAGEHASLTAGLATSLAEPLSWNPTAGMFHQLPEWSLRVITGALFPDSPELDSVLSESLREPLADADVPWVLKSRNDGETDPSLEYVLARLDPAFASQLRGAMLRIDERGPDWRAQAAVSLRRVLLGVLHRAAPNDLVLPWVTRPKTQIDPQGRPTRRAKIDWLCELIRHDGSREFVKPKLYSALASLDLLNKAIHSNECPELAESFSSVSAIVRSAIHHIATLLERRRSA